MPDHGGNRTYDLWNTSPMLCQLSYAVWHIFQACPVWIYTQSNITSIIFTRVHYTNTEKSCIPLLFSKKILKYIILSIIYHQPWAISLPIFYSYFKWRKKSLKIRQTSSLQQLLRFRLQLSNF